MTHDVDNPPHCERDTKRNEHEDIEITEEMIEAGIEAFCTFDPRFEREDSVAWRLDFTDPIVGAWESSHTDSSECMTRAVSC